MAEFRPATPEQAESLAELTGAGLLVPTDVPGVYGRGVVFEEVRLRFGELIGRIGQADGAERILFPPLIPRRHLEDIGYLKSFPHLVGTIFSFEGGEREAALQDERASRHEDWSEFQRMTDLVLAPAACYPVYPAVAARGTLTEGGVTVDAGAAYVFRNEPSDDPARLQMFHQREIVRIGEPEVVSAWRDAWRDRALELLRDLGLDVAVRVASDPFFGRSGRMLAANQRDQALKFEIDVQLAGPEPTALASFNYHQDHFASVFDLRTAHGDRAHTACLGFGEERIVVALFGAHGLDVGAWPATVRERLWGTS
jgi:seryl-tRNA synthetase